jgi:hypothetical protein
VPGPDLYAVPAGIPAHRRYGQVQISERIGHRIEVTAEDDDFRERQEPGRVGVVAAGTLDDLREKTGGGGALIGFPKLALASTLPLTVVAHQSSPAARAISVRSMYPAARMRACTSGQRPRQPRGCRRQPGPGVRHNRRASIAGIHAGAHGGWRSLRGLAVPGPVRVLAD